VVLPARVLAWYGDDFTGSTDVLEVLACAGLPCVLFLAPPTAEDLARFADVRAIGLAGVSRARSPEWMDAHLPDALAALARLDVPLLHYKVCSTFDSSPSIGSIGRALEIGRIVVGARGATPVVVGAPPLKRYTVFGQLFATADGVTWRIDRHPTMSRHPVTPMNEADLSRHLAAQTRLPIALMDIHALRSPDFVDRYAHLAAGVDGAVLIDVLDDETLARAGELVWRNTGGIRFCVGSSGLEYALVAHWRGMGLLDAKPPMPTAQGVDRVFAVSGSCSPMTATQIDAAESAGHATIALDAAALLQDAGASAVDHAQARATAALAAGRSAIVYTARGPQDPAVAAFREAAAAHGLDLVAAGERVGAALCVLFRNVVGASGLKRAVIAGGDTAGEVAGALGVRALSMVAPLAPGSPLCRAYAPGTPFDGLELVLKGGQVGGQSFFEDVRRGRIS